MGLSVSPTVSKMRSRWSAGQWNCAFLAVFFVALLCVIAVMVAGTYGMLHKGDDFDFGGGSGGGGDVIVLNGLL